jgi:hypothetical protein
MKRIATKPAKPTAPAQTKKPSALALAAESAPEKEEHRLILQVNTNDPAAMNLAINNAMNVTQYCPAVIGANAVVPWRLGQSHFLPSLITPTELLQSQSI